MNEQFNHVMIGLDELKKNLLCPNVVIVVASFINYLSLVKRGNRHRMLTVLTVPFCHGREIDCSRSLCRRFGREHSRVCGEREKIHGEKKHKAKRLGQPSASGCQG